MVTYAGLVLDTESSLNFWAEHDSLESISIDVSLVSSHEVEEVLSQISNSLAIVLIKLDQVSN